MEVSKKKMNAFEAKAHRRLLNITHKLRKNNIYVSNEIIKKNGNYELVLDIVVCRKITLFLHISRHESLAKMILQGSVKAVERYAIQRETR